MDDLEAIRQRKLRELQEQQASANQGAEVEEAQRAQAEAALEGLLQKILDPEARERLTRIRMSRPQLADQVSAQLVALARSGRLDRRLGDEDLRAILAQMQPASRDINITRK